MKGINYKVVLGVAPTKRDDPAFLYAKALENKVPLYEKLKELGIEFVDIDDVCPHGIMMSMDDVAAVEKKFRAAGVNAVFIPHVMYGSEPACAWLAKRMNLPTLMWGPRDPKGNLTGGKTQIGVFPVGKALGMVGAPFTYIPTCYLDDPMFEKGLRAFFAVARVVNNFRNMRILQVGTRPETFWACIVNEGEMLSKFGIYTYPIEVSELVAKARWYMENQEERCRQLAAEIEAQVELNCVKEVLFKSAGMKFALEEYAEKTGATGVAIQCWYEMQKQLGIWPCTAGAILATEGLPVICETDVLGAISCILAQAATGGEPYPHFADFFSRHPENDNGECAGHCGVTPFCMIEGKPGIARRLPPHDQTWGGGVTGPIKKSDRMTFMRLDQENGEYKLLLGRAKAIDGPPVGQPASYTWFEVENWPELEYKLVQGPFVHHVAIINEDITAILCEATRYMKGVTPYFPFDSDRKAAESYFYTE